MTHDLGHGLRLHLQDPENPMLEFVTASGSCGINIRALADERRGRITGEALKWWLIEHVDGETP